MTRTEIALKKALNPVWELYKRYDEDEDDRGLPDVLSLLEQTLSEANDKLAGVARTEERFPDNRYNADNRRAWETEIKAIKETIEGIKESPTSLFAVSATVFDRIPHIVPIVEKPMPLYEANVGDTNGSLAFSLTKNNVIAQVVPAACALNRKEAFITPQSFRGRPIYSEKGFVGLDYLYIDPKVDSSCKYFVCKDCGEVFVMHISQIIHFRKKGLKIPKRCVMCRERRKKGTQL